MKNYLFNILIALDQNLNTLFAGYPDETVSLRAARERDINNKKWACVLCKVLDLFESDHCTKTVESKRLSLRYRRM